MATIINNVSLATGEITSTAVTSDPSLLRIQTEITGAVDDEFVIQSYLTNDGTNYCPLLAGDYVTEIKHKIIGNDSVSINLASINSASIKVKLTPGAAGNAGSATVNTKEA